MHTITYTDFPTTKNELQRLNPDIDSLEIRSIHCSEDELIDLLSTLSTIPLNLKYLRLTNWSLIFDNDTRLKDKTNSFLIKMSQALPDSLLLFDLSYCGLLKKSLEDFYALIANAPRRATALDLSNNFFEQASVEEAEKRLTAIPPHFNTLMFNLGVSLKKFYEAYPAPDFKRLLGTIPQTINTLYWDKTPLQFFPVKYLRGLKGALPSITTLYVSSINIGLMNQKKLDAFAEMFPNLEHIVEINHEGNVVTSPHSRYVQAKLAGRFEIKSIYALSRLEKRPLTQTAEASKPQVELPEELIENIAPFLSKGQSITKGVKILNSPKQNLKPSFFHALNPASKHSGLMLGAREILDSTVGERIAYTWNHNSDFISAIKTTFDILVGKHYSPFLRPPAESSAKGVLDYLILPLLARKLIADTYLEERKECHLTNLMAWTLAIPLEFLRFSAGVALTLISAPIVALVKLSTFCIDLHDECTAVWAPRSS